MPQQLTLVLDPEFANGLIQICKTAMRVNDFESGRFAVPIINDLLRQDAEYKKLNPELPKTLAPVPNQTAE